MSIRGTQGLDRPRLSADLMAQYSAIHVLRLSHLVAFDGGTYPPGHSDHFRSDSAIDNLHREPRPGTDHLDLHGFISPQDTITTLVTCAPPCSY
jgi:hypothetical protein